MSNYTKKENQKEWGRINGVACGRREKNGQDLS
jgi:hypothetical protein